MTSALRACCVLLTQEERYNPWAARARFAVASILQRMRAVGCFETIAMPARPGPRESPYVRIFLYIKEGPSGPFCAANMEWSKGPPVHSELLADSVDVLVTALRNSRRVIRTAHAVRRRLGLGLTTPSTYEAAKLYVTTALASAGQDEEPDLARVHIGRPVLGLQ
jgi:hypothetical protein